MAERTVILSDLHLGRAGAPAVAQLRPLWQGCSHLIINGDLAEVHHPRYRGPAAREVIELYRLCEEDDVRVVLISGNHDAFITDRRHLLLHDNTVLLLHGDALHPGIAPWCASTAHLEKVYHQAMARYRKVTESMTPMERVLTASQHAAFKEWDEVDRLGGKRSKWDLLWHPIRMGRVISYWNQYPKLAAEFAKEHAPLARFVITGHSHRQGVWEMEHVTVINTGSFDFPGKPQGIIFQDNQMMYQGIVREGECFGWAKEITRWWSMPQWNVMSVEEDYPVLDALSLQVKMEKRRSA